MADFDIAIHKLDIVEGGYANIPQDRGGETYRGIARKYHWRWPGWAIIDDWKRTGRSMDYLRENRALEKMVEAFYKEHFWDTLRLDEVERQDLAEELFDSGVNANYVTATLWLQRALNLLGSSAPKSLKVDGKMGPKTLAAVNSCSDPRALLKTLNGLQFMHYFKLVEKYPDQRMFFRGWLKRVWEH